MKIAVVGSRNITVADIGRYISDAEEIVSGGAVGVDSCAAEYAKENGIKLTVFLPDYKKYKRGAPLIRNREINEENSPEGEFSTIIIHFSFLLP